MNRFNIKYRYLKNKAFTLIELLAVILILGIIALIAVPTVNDVLTESRMGAFKSTAMNLANKAEETCQLENIKDKDKTYLYTIVDGKLDKQIDIKGDIPNEGYILVNNNCETAFSFYDSKNVVSKNFSESKPNVYNKENVPSYGLNWRINNNSSSTNYLDDTFKRTLDAEGISNNSVNVQIGNEVVTNAFDGLEIYKDILPYTDEFGNEFMLIPKFYISKTKKITDDEIIWDFAVSKYKLDNTYYLPANFVDEGVNNDKHIELPYVLVGKYESGSNGLTGDNERIVSKSGLTPRGNLNINRGREMINRYNNDEVSGYQQYDIHIHDIITTLLAIEFGKMNSQDIMMGYTFENTEYIKTGESDVIKSSSGTLGDAGHNSFHYRGMENLWGNTWTFVDGIIIDQTNGLPNHIYTSKNSRLYSEDITSSYEKVETYTKLDDSGWIKDLGFDPKYPFVIMPIDADGTDLKGLSDYYWQLEEEALQIMRIGGANKRGETEGLNFICTTHDYDAGYNKTFRLIKTPLS